MAVLNVTSITTAGVAPPAAVAAAAGGDTFANDGRTVLTVINGAGASRTVTIDSVNNCDQGFDHNLAVVVPAGATRRIGPFPPARFGNPVSVTYSDAAAGLTVYVEKV